jgi:C-terminal processing protease CtpA/Prc
MIGDQCYIAAVKPGSDAEKKGLKPGDILHVVDGYKITRETFFDFNYLYNQLQPKASLSVVVKSANEQPRKVEFNASTRRDSREIGRSDLIREELEYQRINPPDYKVFGGDLFVWKMPRFNLTEKQVNEFVEQANKTKSLILDLRGNRGRDEQILLKVIGDLFDHDIKVGEFKSRNDTSAFVAKTRGHDIFKGQLILLVDSGSSSAAELLARVVQIEKRGTVIGDQTAGSVGRARYYVFPLSRKAVYYGVSVTEASIVMTDGKALEHIGVIPNKLMLPTSSDLHDGADPVLSYAASLVGVKLDPKEAGALFPIRWKIKP